MLALSFIAPPALLGLVLTMQALESRLLGRREVGDRRGQPLAQSIETSRKACERGAAVGT
jgi:hypothetical protein